MSRKRRGRPQEPPEDILQVGEELFGLDRGGVEALGILMGMCPLFEKEGDSFEDDLLAKVGMMLTYPGVAEAVAEMAVLSEPILHDLALRVATADHDGDKAAAFFVLARIEELRGNVLGAEAMVEEALAADADYLPAVVEGAIFASERGEARKALEFFRRAGEAPDAGPMAMLRAFARPPTSGVARNSPCPCGSGKKHKLCCMKTGHPLERRASWLIFKIASWAVRTSAPTLMADLARDMFDGDPDDDVLLEVALRDAAILDVAVFDLGLLDEYLDGRGVLLPDDERELARSWLKTRRSAYEVISVTARRGCRLRDLLTGDEMDVDDPEGWDFYQPLEILLARLVPAGLTHVFFGSPTVVPRPQRYSLVAMLKEDDSWEGIVEWRLASTRRPHLVNMEGEDVEMCRALFEISDRGDAAAALERALPEEEEGRFVSKVEVDGQVYIRGWISLEDDSLEVTTNSLERFEEMKSLVSTSVAGARLVSEERQKPEELLSASDPRSDRLQEPPSPEALEVLDAHMAAYEEQWLDMSIPALGGATPQEAVDDPRLRGELEALLDDFDWSVRRHDGPGRGMDPRRIRALLGI
ncbi:MAG: SEC-C metal-binding domain-containing protein [Actinomycetota bacterium]